MNTSVAGTMDTSDIASSWPHCCPDWESLIIRRARPTVYFSTELMYSRCPRKSSQFHRKQKIMTVTIAGFVSGMMMRQ
ncbi:hypothetical protein D3C87_2055300 [compost metagenome]